MHLANRSTAYQYAILLLYKLHHSLIGGINMKKKVAVGLTLLLVLALSVMAFAETIEVPEWYQEMKEWRQERLETALDEGLITEEQAEWKRERWEAMEEYRLENGFEAGFGPCRDGVPGEGFRGGFGGGAKGRGMMGGFGGRFGGFNRTTDL